MTEFTNCPKKLLVVPNLKNKSKDLFELIIYHHLWIIDICQFEVFEMCEKIVCLHFIDLCLQFNSIFVALMHFLREFIRF